MRQWSVELRFRRVISAETQDVAEHEAVEDLRGIYRARGLEALSAKVLSSSETAGSAGLMDRKKTLGLSGA